MPNLFGIDIAGLVATNLGPSLVPGVLLKITPGQYDINDPASGNKPTTVQYTCRLVATELKQITAKDDLLRTWTGKVTVLLGTIAGGVLPAIGDSLVFVAPGETALRTFNISGEIDVDPAGATVTCSVVG